MIDQQNRQIQGIFLRLLATVLLALMLAAVHGGCLQCNTGQVILMRGGFAIPVVLLYLLFRGELSTVFTTKRWSGHAWRGVLGSTSLALTFLAVRELPLPLAAALTFLAPVFVTIGAVTILGEQASKRAWSAVLLGFGGIVLLLWAAADDLRFPQLSFLGVSSGIGGALLMAASILQLKRLSSTESIGLVSLFFSCAIAVMGCILTIRFGWGPMSGTDVLLGALAGVLGACAHLVTAESIRRAPLVVVAPIDYLLLVWTVGLNFILFSMPTPALTVVGVAVIVGSSMLLWTPSVEVPQAMKLKRPD